MNNNEIKELRDLLIATLEISLLTFSLQSDTTFLSLHELEQKSILEKITSIKDTLNKYRNY